MPRDSRASTMPAHSRHSLVADAHAPTQWLAISAIFLVALLPLFASPVLPFIDFYNHLARYYVLATIDQSALLQANYKSNWAILPNIGLDIIVTGLMKILPEPAVARTTVILIFAVQYSGVLYFNRALTGRWSALVAVLTVPLLYSFILNWGFANFLLGLGLTFWAAGWWMSKRGNLALALPVACLLATAIFFVHGLAFALYGTLVGMLEIGLFLHDPVRRLASLVRAMLPLLAQAIIPVILFLTAQTSKSSEGITNADEAIVRLSSAGRLGQRLWELFQHRMVTILRVAEGPSMTFDIVTLVAMTAFLVVLLARRRIALAPAAVPAIVIGIVFVIVAPPAMFGVGYVADRMPLFLALLLVGSLDVRFIGDVLERGVVAGMTLLVAARLVGIAIDWRDYARDNDDFGRVAGALPPGAIVDTIVVGGERLDYEHRRCQMYGPLLIAEHGAIGRLFANESQQPLLMTGPLRAAINSQPRPDRSLLGRPGYFDDVVAAAAASDFSYLFVCDADRLKRPMPEGVRKVAQSGRFTLLARDFSGRAAL